MPPFTARASLGLLTMLAVGCGLNRVDKPTPPDTEQARMLLADPDGHFAKGDDAKAMFESIEAALHAFEGMCGYDPASDVECLTDPLCRRCAILAELGDALRKLARSLQDTSRDAADAGTGPDIPGLRGLLQVDITCKGFEGAPEPDPANGFAHLTVGFTSRGIDKVAWGEFDDCATLAADQPVRLNGDFTLDFDADAVRRRNLDTTPVVFSFQGSVLDVELGMLDQGRLIVYQRLDGKGEFALGLGNGSLGTFVAEVSQDTSVLMGAEGSFTCDVEEGTCELHE